MIPLRGRDVRTMLDEYGIHVPVTDARYLAHGELERGIPLRIEGIVEGDGSRKIVISTGDRPVERLSPVPGTAAESMLEQLHTEGVPLTAQMIATLTHVLSSCSRLFENDEIDRFELAPLYIRENDYRVIGAKIWRKARLRVRSRLAPHAHDVGAVFPYRPSRPRRLR